MPHQVSYVNEATLFQLSFAFAEEISVPTIDTNSNGPLEASYCHSDGNKKWQGKRCVERRRCLLRRDDASAVAEIVMRGSGGRRASKMKLFRW
eukprot:scaffold7172_cov149-Skeletonema_menzelii.AAC.3